MNFNVKRQILVFISCIAIYHGIVMSVYSQNTSFTFGAGGDHSANSSAASVFKKIAPNNLDFFLSLGDLRYGQSTDTGWCAFVKNNINAGAGKPAGDPYGETYPFEIIAGGHENGMDNVGDGLIDIMVAPGCLPDRLNVTQSPNLGTNPSATGNYGKEYYFDYPAFGPIARFIMVDPQQNFKHGGYYDFAVGGARYNWLRDRIDEARARGIQWVIVGNHENYISTGNKLDEVGSAYFNLLISKKVDLILQGHDHNYQRSKQLALGAACTTISASSSTNLNCVTDDGADAIYTKGNGSVLIINGSGGIGHYNTTTTDAQNGYFARWMGNTSTDITYGFTKFTVTTSQIIAQFIPAAGGSFSDSFTITTSSAPTTIQPSPLPLTPTAPISTLIPTQGTATCPASAAGKVTASFSVQSGGSYKIWSRIKVKDLNNNSYYMQADQQCLGIISSTSILTPDEWIWVDYKNGLQSNKVTVDFVDGTHTLSLVSKDGSIGIDRLIITSNMNCVPTDMGENCAGGAVTITPTLCNQGGDANCDGIINLIDFEIFRKEFAGELTSKQADFNGDGIVSLADFEAWRRNFF